MRGSHCRPLSKFKKKSPPASAEMSLPRVPGAIVSNSLRPRSVRLYLQSQSVFRGCSRRDVLSFSFSYISLTRLIGAGQSRSPLRAARNKRSDSTTPPVIVSCLVTSASTSTSQETLPFLVVVCLRNVQCDRLSVVCLHSLN